VPTADEAAFSLLCEKGTSIPSAALYAGKVHPLVVMYVSSTSIDSATGGVIHLWSPVDLGINAKWITHSWSSPIQLIVCYVEHAQRVGTCGPYGAKGLPAAPGSLNTVEIHQYRDDWVARVFVARTGKYLQSKTFKGGRPKACPASVKVTRTGSGLSAEDIWGSFPRFTLLNNYATAVSTQKA